MKMMLTAKCPPEPFNTHQKEGKAGQILMRIIEETQPEKVFFTESEGQRCAVMIIEVNDSSQVPHYAEPWYLNFEADCEFRIVMEPKDLQKAGLDDLAKKWR